MPIDDRDKDKTAFITRQGLYDWNTMPFGLTNVSATFERLMELVLCGLTESLCLVYLDDAIVFGHDFEETLRNFRTIILYIQQIYTSNHRSAHFFQEQVAFLGHS